jgi:hypothetical protein
MGVPTAIDTAFRDWENVQLIPAMTTSATNDYCSRLRIG